ncbi:MAG: phenylacetate--CoA ligase family protein [Alphaproteobacteria bacterium]
MDTDALIAELLARKWAKLRSQIPYVFNNSDYFRDRFRAAGIDDPRDVRTMEDFRDLPIMMDKSSHRQSQLDSLERHGHPFGMHLCVPKEKIIHVAATSGTTGHPTFYTYTRRDLEITQKIFSNMFDIATIRPGDTVYTAFGLSLWLAGVTVILCLEAHGATPVPVGAEAGPTKILQYLKLTRPRVLMGTPSLLAHLIERAPAEIDCEVGDLGIEVLFCGGEPGAGIPAIRERLMGAYGAKIYDITGGAWHNGTISCDSPDYHGMHQMGDDYSFRWDLVDPETKKPLPLADGTIGEVVQTGLEYEAGPAFRYAIGDIIRLRAGECPGCGHVGTRMEIMGRTDDILNLKGVKVYPASVKEVISEFQPDISGQVQILLDAPPPRVEPPLQVRVEAGETLGTGDREALAARIEDRVHNVLSIRARIEIVDFGAIGRSNLKTKLLVVRDAG